MQKRNIATSYVLSVVLIFGVTVSAFSTTDVNAVRIEEPKIIYEVVDVEDISEPEVSEPEEDVSTELEELHILKEEIVEEPVTEEAIIEESVSEEEPIIEEPVVEDIIEEPLVTYYDVPLSQDLQNYIFKLCEERDIDPALVIAIIERESNYDASTIGDSGDSLGLMQIQPKWHQERMSRLYCTDLLNPFENVCVGIDILDELLDSGNSIEWALMAYNGGCGYAYDKAASGEISEYATTVLHITQNLKN
jgi:hypothetical protein